MLNPDRTELGLQSTSAPENSRKNTHIPRWLRVPTFAARTFLAVLTATPGVVAANTIYNTIKPSIVYADSPTGKISEIQRVGDCRWNVIVEVTDLRPGTRLMATNYYDWTDCQGNHRSGSYGPYYLGVADNSGRNVSVHPQSDFGSYSKIITDSDGHQLSIQYSYDRNYTSKTPLPTQLAKSPMKTPTRPPAETTPTAEAKLKRTPTVNLTPVPEIRPTQVAPIGQPTTPTGISDWLWGLGAASLAGFAAYWGYRRGKLKNSPPPPSGIGGVGGPSNPNTAPNTGPSTAPSTGPARPKNPEWVIGQKDFKRRWQEVKSKLPPLRPGDTGNEQGYILDRFKAGMNVIHEVSLEDVTGVPEIDTRLRAGIEYLIAEIWPDNRIFKRFFDPQFNAGILTPEDLARIIYLPESYRHLSVFTKAQRTDVMRIRRTLLHALHPDLLKTDSDPKLKDSLDLLLKQLNSAWPLINKLLS